MTKLLYWIVYHFDLGPLGPNLLDFAVRSWLKRAKQRQMQPMVRRQRSGWLTSLHLEPGFDKRM